MVDVTGDDAPIEERGDPEGQYPPTVNTEARRGAAMYRRARRDLEGALDDLVTRANALIGAGDGDELIEMARRIRAQSIDVTTYAVLTQRAAGQSWTQIAVSLSLDESFVREHYEPIETQWASGGGIGPVVQREGQRLRVVSG